MVSVSVALARLTLRYDLPETRGYCWTRVKIKIITLARKVVLNLFDADWIRKVS